MDNDRFEDQPEPGGLFDRIRESPRTVSAIIIILIIAAAIYAFSGEEAVVPSPTPVVEEEAAITEAPTTPLVVTTPSPLVTLAPKTPAALSEEVRALPEGRREASAFAEIAQPGDGITHLARRAATRWLAENEAGYAVTNEHRIYIEDYLKDRIGTEGLAIGEERTISFAMVAEAVAAAGTLTDSQLRNLTKYTYVLP